MECNSNLKGVGSINISRLASCLLYGWRTSPGIGVICLTCSAVFPILRFSIDILTASPYRCGLVKKILSPDKLN